MLLGVDAEFNDLVEQGKTEPPRRRKKSAKAELEEDLLQSPRWSGLRQKQRLQALHHTSQQNAADRAACRALVEGGWGTDQEYVAWRNQ